MVGRVCPRAGSWGVEERGCPLRGLRTGNEPRLQGTGGAGVTSRVQTATSGGCLPRRVGRAEGSTGAQASPREQLPQQPLWTRGPEERRRIQVPMGRGLRLAAWRLPSARTGAPAPTEGCLPAKRRCAAVLDSPPGTS